MQTKNKTSEFSSLQCSQIKEKAAIHELKAQCEAFRNKLESLPTERCDCLTEQEKLMQHLTSIQEELNVARNDELSWQIKLENVQNSSTYDQYENLQYMCQLLGYQVSKYQISNGLQFTLNYRDICYVSFTETSDLYDIVEIYPSHHNFSQIQQYLQNTQDLRGLLACLRKFFDLATQTKENAKTKI